MANSLNRDIESGEVVVLRRGAMQIKYDDPSSRLFVVRGGFGMMVGSMGMAIMGDDAAFKDGKLILQGRARYNGRDISKSETETWQKEKGRFESEYVKEGEV
jgi:hypothetical protein